MVLVIFFIQECFVSDLSFCPIPQCAHFHWSLYLDAHASPFCTLTNLRLSVLSFPGFSHSSNCMILSLVSVANIYIYIGFRLQNILKLTYPKTHSLFFCKWQSNWWASMITSWWLMGVNVCHFIVLIKVWSSLILWQALHHAYLYFCRVNTTFV